MVAENTLLLQDFIDYAISSLTAIGAIAVAASYGAIAAVGPKTGAVSTVVPYHQHVLEDVCCRRW